MIKTITTALKPTPTQRQSLLRTLRAMADAQAYVVHECYAHEDHNFFRMKSIVYHPLREKFALPAQLAVAASKCACDSVRTTTRRKGQVPTFKGKSIHYDKRSSTIRPQKQLVSLLTLDGRIKVQMRMAQYFHRYLDWETRESNLVLGKDGVFRLFVFVKKPSVASTKMGKVLGVDRGINCLIANSDGLLVEGKEVWKIKKHYASLRGRLQSKGTRSAKRHLVKIRGKEKRFMRDVNHRLSKNLVNSIGKNGVIVFEDLKDILKSRHRHEQNWLFHNWAFKQLENFTKYKAEEASVAVAFVPARYTSQTCSVCGNLGIRNGSVFKCKTCKNVLHADANAAKNILHRHNSMHGQPVNLPIVPVQSVEQATASVSSS